MAKNLFDDWLNERNTSNASELEDYIIRQIPIVKGETDNLKSAKVKLTDLINIENYKCQKVIVQGGKKVRADPNGHDDVADKGTLDYAEQWVLAHIKDKEFLSKIVTVEMLKEQTGMDEAQLIETGLCCISMEQYTFKVPKKA